VATFVGTSNLVHADCAGGVGRTRFGAVRLLNRPPLTGRAIVVLRPEHLQLAEAPNGPARGETWRIVRRRFAGAEILLEVEASDGLRVWCEAGPQVRRLRLGDNVSVRLRDVGTVAFAPRRAAASRPAEVGPPAAAGPQRAPEDEAAVSAPSELPGA
jgi:hypothetical protein